MGDRGYEDSGEERRRFLHGTFSSIRGNRCICMSPVSIWCGLSKVSRGTLLNAGVGRIGYLQSNHVRSEEENSDDVDQVHIQRFLRTSGSLRKD